MYQFLRNAILTLIFNLFFIVSQALAAPIIVVDWLVLYDEGSNTFFNNDPTTAMQAWARTINQIYKDSKIDMEVRVVGVYKNTAIDPRESGKALDAIFADSRIARLRDDTGADFVTQLQLESDNCGLALGLAPGSLDGTRAFTVVKPGCQAAAAAHELAHNMGVSHSRPQGDTSGTIYRYGLGYGVPNLFTDIMAYGDVFGDVPDLNVFSNPNIKCKGVACGISAGQPQEADSALALQNVRARIAAFRPTKTAAKFIRMQKGGTQYSIDGYGGASDGRRVKLWQTSPDNSNINQQWIEINRGSGFYSYQKRETGHCIDGMDGGARNQAVILWPCDANNQNQHWKRIKLSNGKYRLQKRNASGFSIDGGNGAANGQDLLLWNSDDNNVNQQWEFLR